MESALISLLFLVIVVGLIAALAYMLIDVLPIDAQFKYIAKIIVFALCILILLVRLLPMAGVSI